MFSGILKIDENNFSVSRDADIVGQFETSHPISRQEGAMIDAMHVQLLRRPYDSGPANAYVSAGGLISAK